MNRNYIHSMYNANLYAPLWSQVILIRYGLYYYIDLYDLMGYCFDHSWANYSMHMINSIGLHLSVQQRICFQVILQELSTIKHIKLTKGILNKQLSQKEKHACLVCILL